jgi:hypothetical protein
MTSIDKAAWDLKYGGALVFEESFIPDNEMFSIGSSVFLILYTLTHTGLATSSTSLKKSFI